MKNTSLTNSLRWESGKNNQGTYVSKNEAYALEQAVKEMFISNGIEYEVQRAVYKERSPEASVKVGATGIKFKLGFTWKTAMITKITPRGGIFDD